MKEKLKLALVGYGYWGNNLLRNLLAHPKCEVVGVCDRDAAKRAKAAAIDSDISTFSKVDDLLTELKPDAVVVATPPASHCDVAVKSLRAGAHVLIEKPMAVSSQECDRILAEAQKARRTVMVDNTLIYYAPVQYLVNLIESGEMGQLLYFDSVRVNLGGIQPQVNVLWDLAPHDIAVLDQLTGALPVHVSAIGVKHFNAPTETLCYLNLAYENNFNAHLHMNWAAPVKGRLLTIGCDKKMAILDDNVATEKVRIFDKSVKLSNDPAKGLVTTYHHGSTFSPALPAKEALAEVLEEFVSSITENRPPKTDGESGARVVRILEAASISLANGGRPEKVGSSQSSRFKAA
jgi:predicted dehydrogenase